MSRDESGRREQDRLGIIYVSIACPKVELHELIAAGRPLPMQALRFHRLLVSGLAASASIPWVEALALRPMTAWAGSGKTYPGFEELDEGVRYHYLRLPSIPFVRQLSVFAQTVSIMYGICAKPRNVSRIYVLTDALNLFASLAARAVSFLFGVRCVAIVTDVPLSMHRMAHPRLTLRALGSLAMNVFRMMSMSMFDGFVFLTNK